MVACTGEIAATLEPISLAEVGRAALMDRVDTKYTVPADEIPALIRAVRDYRVLEVAGERLSRYRTTYYDTSDLAFYHAHHSGRYPRYKVRTRTYEDSGVSFAEVKRKTNTERTVKTRVELHVPQASPSVALRCLVGHDAHLMHVIDDLHEAAVVTFRRLTLVHRRVAERVTIDLQMVCTVNGNAVRFPRLAVVEIKRATRTPSELSVALDALHIRAATISKYCLAIATLSDRAKTNEFKATLRRLDKYHLSDHGHSGN